MTDKFSFKKLEIQDKNTFDKFFENHTVYSDFNFTSLYTWDIDNKAEFCFFNDNLVIKFQDYLTRKHFYSFLGINRVVDTIDALMELSSNDALDLSLKMVPEEAILSDFSKITDKYKVFEDRDNFDYVYYLPDLATLKGNKYYNQRNLVNRFKRQNPDYEIKTLDMTSNKIQSEIDSLFVLWGDRKENKEHVENEHECFRRLFDLCKFYDYHAVGLYVSNKLIGFAINELLNYNFVLAHYRKADVEFAGAYKVLEQESAIQLVNKGYKYLNYEQDAGLTELRQSKRSWSTPEFYLYKYTISKY